MHIYCIHIADIRSVLNDRVLITKIADLLEQGSGNSLSRLAVMFHVNEPSQLTSVEPSRRFFTNLAETKVDITLADLKKLIEHDLGVQRLSIFPPIEEAIAEKRVAFTLESTLVELKGKNWLYLLENIANKLLENNCNLPSWKNIADHYDYSHSAIESFSLNLRELRPTFKLFQYLSFMENVPKIATLRSHLKILKRNDIIKLLDERSVYFSVYSFSTK